MKTSVVITAWNCEAYVAEAVDSILAQDAADFECIVVDDGSGDGTPGILAGYADPRLRVVTLPANCGLAIARNVGIACALGEYVAIMDADDVAHPNRLSTQAAWLDAHPDVHILGSRGILFEGSVENAARDGRLTRLPAEGPVIKARLLLMNGTSMLHPSTMLRRQFICDNKLWYPPRKMSVDSAFWIECVARGANFHSLKEPLLYKRRHANQVHLVHKDEMAPEKTPLRQRLAGMFFPELAGSEARALAILMEENRKLSVGEVCAGIAAGNRALLERRSFHGESREHLQQIVRHVVSNAAGSIRSA